MKYIAIFDEDVLIHFRRDDEGSTLVAKDARECTRAVSLKPLNKPVIVNVDGEITYLTEEHIKNLMEYEQHKIKEQAWNCFECRK